MTAKTWLQLTITTVQVKKWDIFKLREFWQRWYFPANATLYVVGDFNLSVEELEAEIHSHFGKVPAGRMPAPGEDSYAVRQQKLHTASTGNGAAGVQPSGNGWGQPAAPQWDAMAALRSGEGPFKQRFPVRHRCTTALQFVHSFLHTLLRD